MGFTIEQILKIAEIFNFDIVEKDAYILTYKNFELVIEKDFKNFLVLDNLHEWDGDLNEVIFLTYDKIKQLAKIYDYLKLAKLLKKI